MDILEQNKPLLAMQSVYASLHIHRRAPVVQPAQTAYDQLLEYYGDASKINNTPTDIYSIVNLPPTMLRIPVNTIYDRIMFIPTDMPDFRFVRVSKSDSSQVVSTLRSGVLKDDIISANCAVPVDACTLLLDEFSGGKKKNNQSPREVNVAEVVPLLIRDIRAALRADKKNSPDSVVVDRQSFAGALVQAAPVSDNEQTNTNRVRLITDLISSNELDESDFIGISARTVLAIRRRIDDFV